MKYFRFIFVYFWSRMSTVDCTFPCVMIYKLMNPCRLFPKTGYTQCMCGRYRRRSDKQRIVEAFELGTDLEDHRENSRVKH